MAEGHGRHSGKAGDNYGLRNCLFGKFRIVPNNITVIPTSMSWFLVGESRYPRSEAEGERESCWLGSVVEWSYSLGSAFK